MTAIDRTIERLKEAKAELGELDLPAGGRAVLKRIEDGLSHRPRFAMRRSERQPLQFPAVSVGALALGAVAVGAIAIGTIAIGRLVMGRLSIGRARIRDLDIENLTVHRLRVQEDIPFRPDDPGPMTPSDSDQDVWEPT